MKKLQKYAVLALAAVFVAIQLVPVHRDNPPVASDLDAPADVKSILRRACYDCHSNETRWPWYAYVAPVSWLVAHDVEEGRRELNFSIWGSYPEKKRISHAGNAVEEIEEGHMPLPKYLITHRDARVTPEELEKLRAWSESL